MFKLAEFSEQIGDQEKQNGRISWPKISLSPRDPFLSVFIGTRSNQILLGDNLLLFDITAFY